MIRRIKILIERAIDAIADELAPKIAHRVTQSAIAEATRTLSCQLLAEGAARSQAQQRSRELVAAMREYELQTKRWRAYFADVPRDGADGNWTESDRRQLANFIETSDAGKKLLQHLTNRLADYERAAVVMSTPNNAALLCKLAHGFRDCRGEILRLSAAGPSPANHEQEDFALPSELENLRG